MGLAFADRMFQLLDSPPAIVDKPDAAELKVAQPTMVFDDVRFTYADGTEALKGVSFTVPAGKTAALVGASGSGKSTILNLIPRFYDVTGGAIRIDGTDIRDVTLKSLRKRTWRWSVRKSPFSPGLVQGLEPALVQMLVTELAIEVLDVAVLHGTPWLDQDVANAAGLRPGHECPAGELSGPLFV